MPKRCFPVATYSKNCHLLYCNGFYYYCGLGGSSLNSPRINTDKVMLLHHYIHTLGCQSAIFPVATQKIVTCCTARASITILS